MDAHLLQAFVAVIDQGSFSEAAERLHLTQPAISKRLSALENLTGNRLIDRSNRKIRLTDAGARLLPHARRIIDEVHNARLALSDRNDRVSGRLSVIASHHIGLHHLPAWLRRLNREFPEVSLELKFMDSESALGMMEKRTAELAFVTLSESMSPLFQVETRWEDEMAFMVSPEHPLARLTAPTLADLARYDALLPEAGTATYRRVSRLFLDEGLTLQLQMPTNYLETIKVMAGVGLGWSVLPVNMLDQTLIRLPMTYQVSRLLGGIGLRGRTLSPQAKALLTIAEELQ
ncbi:LysR family transcriptional regulator [Marinobacter confluentis]|uniref:LysR family transcriptional regulator n=1 Tax=Marinobacter confluentis TaxID=1697557 RepID=A0A4Z1C566_9GAMM|nr:LysR family transcriptional regulator [Marinobacter confluentis]TGN41581.1 LysR family transcriptional regulator [Marinobacter confluentis]